MLVAILGICGLRIADTAIEQQTGSFWCFNLFRQLSSRRLIISICLLYGLFSVWVLVGVCWFLLSQAEEQCFLHSKEHFDYYFIWLWFCYFWMTVYTCALLVSSLRSVTDADLVYFDSPLLQPLLVPAEGLSDHSLRDIEVLEVQDNQGLDDCTVCIEPFTAGDCARRLACGHAFHQRCIDPWLRRNPNCPNCKRNLH